MLGVPKSGVSVVIAVMFCEPCLCQNPNSSTSLAQRVERQAIVPDQFSSYATIFVADLETVRPVGGCGRLPGVFCAHEVTVRVTRILKGRDQVPREFEAVIPPWHRSLVPPQGWDMILQLEAKRSYLILSREEGQPKLVFESPESVLMLSDGEDAVGDVALILDSRSSNLTDKVSGFAAILRQGKSRSFFLAQYAVVLLKVGPEPERKQIVRSIEDAREAAFSDRAKWSLLFGLWELSNGHSPSSSDDHIRHLLTTLTARYLIAMPDPLSGSEPDWRDMIARKFVPLIWDYPGGATELRAAFDTIRNAAKRPLTAKQRARLSEWLLKLQ
jgi:hypothetical protein